MQVMMENVNNIVVAVVAVAICLAVVVDEEEYEDICVVRWEVASWLVIIIYLICWLLFVCGCTAFDVWRYFILWVLWVCLISFTWCLLVICTSNHAKSCWFPSLECLLIICTSNHAKSRSKKKRIKKKRWKTTRRSQQKMFKVEKWRISWYKVYVLGNFLITSEKSKRRRLRKTSTDGGVALIEIVSIQIGDGENEIIM